MSKSKKKTPKSESKKKAVEILDSITTAGRNPDFDDDDGFQTLAPTDKGRKALEEIRVRRSKKSETAVKPEPDEAPRTYAKYDAQLAAKMLNDITPKVKDGKFKKALELRDLGKKNVLEDLIDAFKNMDSDLPNFPKVCEVITKLLRIGKTFYEYGDGLEFIDNITYDGIIARYRALGMTEPQEYVPDSKKSGKSKVAVKYPKLHNTMDKAYAIRTGDRIPDGVKESDRVEDFLVRVYTALGLSSEVKLTLELSPKIDGVSVNGTIHNRDGKSDVLMAPQTRGDESESVKIIGMDGLEVGDGMTDDDFGIQYEAFVTDEDRIKASEYLKLERPYVSNRHAASGLINRLSSGEDDNLLQFISLYPIESSGLDGTYAERMDVLSNYGVMPEDMLERKIIKGNLKELLDKIEKRFKKFAEKREDLSYSIDGLVITVADDEQQKVLGRNGRTNLYQIAMKFDPASADAEVTGIHLDTGNKGFRTVQVDLKHPVFLDGVRYDHVPVLSAKLYEDLGMRVGSKVNVHRVGDVIPSISMIKRGDGEKLTLPDECPDCGERLEIKNKKLYCSNPACDGNLSGRILGFFTALGMDGYGEAFADLIVEKFGTEAARNRPASNDDKDEKIQTVWSLRHLFKLTPKQFKRVGVTTKDAKEFQDKLRDAVAKAEDYVILGAIGVPDLGASRAKMILKEHGSWEAFMDALNDRDECGIKRALGAKIGHAVSYFMMTNDDTHSLVVNDLHEVTKHMKNFTESFESLLKVGHTGGNLSPKIKKLCKAQQFEIVDGKSFDILITNSMESDSDKMKTARKKNLPIFTEETFRVQYDPDYEPEEDDSETDTEDED